MSDHDPNAEVKDRDERLRQSQLATYESHWRETQNPFYIWEALRYCPADRPLPTWIYDYLMKIHRVACDTMLQEDLSGDAAVDAINEVIGLRRKPNWNAVKERREDRLASSIAFNLMTGVNSSMTMPDLINQLADTHGLSPRQIKNLAEKAGVDADMRKALKAYDREKRKSAPRANGQNR